MKIWAISKEKGAEYEIGLECDGMDRETAMTKHQIPCHRCAGCGAVCAADLRLGRP